MRRLLLMLLASLPFGEGAAQGYLCAVGGGDESSGTWARAPYSWIVQKADSQDVIVLSASPETAWIPNFFLSLGARSATNLTIPSRAVANDSATYRAIRACRGVFIKGGDQWNYVSFWKGTLVEQAIREVYLLGGVVAGTSAGAMVLGEVVSDARNGTEVSRNALRNPRSSRLSLTWDFLRLLPSVLIDSHFHERGRLGRLLAMTAAASKDSGRSILGVGIEDMTALCVSPAGQGEVMGSGSVTFFHPTPASLMSVAANTPLVFTSIGYDALVAGFVYDIPNRRVTTVPPSALVPGSGDPRGGTGGVILWGDRFPLPAGMSAFLALAGGTGRVIVVVAPTGNPMGQRLLDTLHARGYAVSLLAPIDLASVNDPATAAMVAGAEALAFIGNATGVAGGNATGAAVPCADSTTLVGRGLRARLASGIPSAFAGPDAGLAGSSMTFGTEIEEYAAYRGRMSVGTGLAAAPNATVMPLIFESDVYDENRCNALPWTMAKTDTKTGFYLDEGGYASVDTAGTVRSSGPTPLVILDAGQSTHVDFSSYRASGSAGPRQEAALIGGTAHVISGDVRWDFRGRSIVTGVAAGAARELPGEFRLEQNYPNPFNPSTTIEFRMPNSGPVTLRVYDLLGREVALLVHEVKGPGTYRVSFNGSRLASGVYYYRMTSGREALTRKMLFIR